MADSPLERMTLEWLTEAEGPSSLVGVMVTVNRTVPEKPWLRTVTWKVLVEPAGMVREWGPAPSVKPVTVSMTVSECCTPPAVAVTVTV